MPTSLKSTLHSIKFKTDVTPKIPVTIRPNFEHYRHLFGFFRSSLILLLIVLLLVRFGANGVPWMIIVPLALLALLVWRLFRRSVTVTEKELIYRNGLGKTRRLALSDIGAVKVLPNYSDPSFGAVARVLIGDKDQKYFVSLLGVYWTQQDMERVVAALEKQGVKVEAYSDSLTWVGINEHFPTLASYGDRHPFVIAFAVVGGIIGLYVIWFLIDRFYL